MIMSHRPRIYFFRGSAGFESLQWFYGCMGIGIGLHDSEVFWSAIVVMPDVYNYKPSMMNIIPTTKPCKVLG